MEQANRYDETKIVNQMLSITSRPSYGLKSDCRIKINEIRWIRIPTYLIDLINKEGELIYVNAYGNWWGMTKEFNGFKDDGLNQIIEKLL